MKKVLVIGPLGETGGVAKYTKELLECNLPYNFVLFNISRLNDHPTYKVIGYQAFYRLSFVRLLKSLFITLLHILKFPFVLLKEQPQIVHIGGTSYFMFWEKSFYILISKLFRVKIVYHFLGAFDQYYESAGKFERKYIEFILNKTDIIALLSNKVETLVASFVPKSKITVIRSSVDVSRFTQSKDLADFYNEDLTDFIFLGGADPQRKGLDVILKAVPCVLRHSNDIRFFLSGSEIIQSELDNFKTTNPDLLSNITYLGWLTEDQKYSVYRSVDAFLLPSFNEGLPYAVIEALAAKLPVIATHVGGIPEVIDEGVNGFLIDFNDFSALAERILTLHRNKTLLKQMSNNNSLKASKYYSLHTVYSQLDTIYQSI